MRRPRTDADCVLWACTACGSCGVITYDSPADAMPFGIASTAEAAHERGIAGTAPTCDGFQGGVRFLAATDWYTQAADLMLPEATS